MDNNEVHLNLKSMIASLAKHGSLFKDLNFVMSETLPTRHQE